MNLTFQKLLLKKIDVNFIDAPSESGKKSQMTIDRSSTVQTNESKDCRLLINSSYQFVINGNVQTFIFEAIFQLNDFEGLNVDDPGAEFFEATGKIVEGVLLPQEVTLIKDILAKFGANIKDGIPMGAPFDV